VMASPIRLCLPIAVCAWAVEEQPLLFFPSVPCCIETHIAANKIVILRELSITPQARGPASSADASAEYANELEKVSMLRTVYCFLCNMHASVRVPSSRRTGSRSCVKQAEHVGCDVLPGS
jgi:hypothetical protein